MFGLFKKPLPFGTVFEDLVEMLARIQESVNGLASEEGMHTSENYDVETHAFAYILGWYAIQASNLGLADKQRFSAELTGAVAKQMSRGDTTKQIELIRLLQERIGAYRHALEEGKGRDRAARLVFRFMEYIGTDNPEQVGVQAALYVAVPNHITALKDFLTDINKTYKLI